MKGLVIRSPWIDKILAGEKIWEMRSKRTNIRGRIALIRAGSGRIFGTAELVDCLPALTNEQMRETTRFHAIPVSQLDQIIANGWTTPWVLRGTIVFPEPISYQHPSGAVTWVNLPDLHQICASESSSIHVLTSSGIGTLSVPVAESRRPTAMPIQEFVDIRVCGNSIRNNRFDLDAAERLFPASVISGPDSIMLVAKTVRVRFDPGSLVETDLSAVKAILSSRTHVGDFFARSGAKPGDSVRLCRESDQSFCVTLRKSIT